MAISKIDAETKLRMLKNQFLNNLPNRIEEIEKIILQITGDNPNKKLFENLMFLAHKLKGVSGTYQMKDVEAPARKMETLATELFSQEEESITEQDRADLEEWLSALKETILDQEISELEPVEEIPKQSSESAEDAGKIVFLIEPDDNICHDLITQFDVYGYNAHVISNLDEIKKQLDRHKEVILVIDTSFLEKSEQDAHNLKQYKSTHGNVTIAFISKHGSFDLRLRAVRAGADAYFVLPLDVNSLIEKLNSFYTKKNQDAYHILIVDDDVDQVALYSFYLQQNNIITSVVSKADQVVSQIIETKPELILMDLNMPGCNGMELAKVIRQQDAFVSIPIVFLSSETNTTKQYEALSFGGDDFLTKPIKQEHLIASISIRVERYRKLRYYMERDSLTGLLNHTRIKEQLRAEVGRAQRNRNKLSFAMLDIDYFKNVNDSYGHLTGDKVLRGLSNLLKERLRKTDIIGRYGGEEFAIIFPNTDSKGAFNVLNRIRESFSRMKHTAGESEFFVTLSAGIATFPNVEDPLKLNEYADNALYKAKDTGRNRIILYNEE